MATQGKPMQYNAGGLNVVADQCMCYTLSVTDGRKQKVMEAWNARKSYLILQGS